MIYTILIAIFVLGVLIIVHELGHFWAAKAVGIQVLRFSVGLGKPIYSFRKGETEYSISWIPFGGYVKMAGEEPAESLEGGEEKEEIDEEEASIEPGRRFDNKPIPARFLVVVAGPLMNFVFAGFLYMGILYFQGADTQNTTTIESVDKVEALAGIDQLQSGSKIISVNGKPVKHWDGVLSGIMDSREESVTLSLTAPGNDNKYDVRFASLSDSLKQVLAYALNPLVSARVGDVISGKPAEKAGVKKGDLIVAVNGEPIESWREVTGIIHASAGKELAVVVERDGERVTLEVTPEKNAIPGADGKFESVGLIGIHPQFVRYRLPLGDAITGGVNNTFYMTGHIYSSLSQLVMGLITRNVSMGDAGNALGGPIMIGQMAGDSARSGNLWAFMAILSLNLALLNLLPIPVLDGGHIIFLLIETVRFGRPLSQKQRIRFIQVGMLIVIGLMVVATANDLRRLFGL